MLTDENGNPIKSEATAEAEAKEAPKGDTQLQVARLRGGQFLLAFMDAATKRLGAIGYMRQLEARKIQEKMVTDPPELTMMYVEVQKLEKEVIGMVNEWNFLFEKLDEERVKGLGLELYTDDDFFGRPMEQSPDVGEA